MATVTSLLDPTDSPWAEQVCALIDELAGGEPEARAVLVSFREEDRVGHLRVRFHEEAVGAGGPARERVRAACGVGRCALEVPAARRGEVQGAWGTFTSLRKLRRFDYVAPVSTEPTEAPPRIALRRRYGTDAARPGEHPFWITSAAGGDADDLRDRLGLTTVDARETLYRIEVAIHPSRPMFVPTALDSGGEPAWRQPPAGHHGPLGLTRDLRDDAPREPELLVHPDDADARVATQVGRLTRPPSREYLGRRCR